MSIESEKAIQEIERKLNDLKSVSRVVSNNLALLSDMEIKGQYAEPLLEVVNWLRSLDKATKDQITVLGATLPKPESPKATVREGDIAVGSSVAG